MSFKEDLTLLPKPYYLVNILLSLSYLISKRIPIVCHILGQEECELDSVSFENEVRLSVHQAQFFNYLQI